MKIFFNDSFFDGQFLRALGYVYYGGADIGECFSTAARIKDGDYESWYGEWMRTADQVFAAAEASQSAGRAVSAREAFLRASNYYRTAFIVLFGTPVDPRLVTAFDQQTNAFRRAATLFSSPVERVDIPYDGTTLPGYFYRVDGTAARRPALIVTGGYDGTVEETYFAAAAAAIRRGYNCLCFDGPGQGEPLIKRQLYFRPDWEYVVRPIVDYALGRPDVDPRRVALMGRSWGGYLAPRAAAGEHRLSACIADPGQYAPVAGFRSRLPLPQAERDRFPNVDDAALQPIVDAMMRQPDVAWALKRGVWTHGVATPKDYLRVMAQYSLAGIAGQISCPTLITSAEDDPVAATAQQLYDALTCPKQFIQFTDAEGAGAHCECGADSLFHQRVFDWLDGIFAALAARS